MARPGFVDIMNTPVCGCDIVSDRLIVLRFESELTTHLEDDSYSCECFARLGHALSRTA